MSLVFQCECQLSHAPLHVYAFKSPINIIFLPSDHVILNLNYKTWHPKIGLNLKHTTVHFAVSNYVEKPSNHASLNLN